MCCASLDVQYISAEIRFDVVDFFYLLLVTLPTACNHSYIPFVGGKGNAFFLSNENRAPTTYEKGGIGEEKTIFVELRVIAHVGLVGLFSCFIASHSFNSDNVSEK